ncbi:thioredoxin family protein, partial [Akkermansiaceae bacterium]|nr:thioredoxin family protein [Akkermansiaceae bacterium]
GVAENFVLVEIDYPQDKSKISEETQKQNAELQEKYQVQQFPTILLMDAQGRPFAQTSYQANGPDNYVLHLNELLKDGEAIKASLDSAAKLDGVKKAEAYINALTLIPATQLSHYQDITNQIPALDPEDTTGFTAKKKLQTEMLNLESEIDTLFNSEKSTEAPALIDKFIAEHTLNKDQLLGLEIMKLQINMVIADQAGNIELAMKHVDDYVASKELTADETQELLSMKVGPLIRAKKFDAVVKLTDEIIAISPDSAVAKMAKQFKTQQLPGIIKQSEEPAPNAPSDSE